ncbi:hypothetical protein [Agarilytica rhodophyticola]|uniref:hypothetical protein n=1 Tax=Agarilytica rhodophyticola TaxID=1737490 RepID=UPI000B347CA9|nr:hypothetical protein [Agarilytica rhodophyticola]
MKSLKLHTHPTSVGHGSGVEFAKKSTMATQYSDDFIDNIDRSCETADFVCDKYQEDVALRDKVTLLVVLMLISTMALSYNWLSFTNLAIVVFCLSSLSAMYKRYRLSSVLRKI